MFMRFDGSPFKKKKISLGLSFIILLIKAGSTFVAKSQKKITKSALCTAWHPETLPYGEMPPGTLHLHVLLEMTEYPVHCILKKIT